MSSLPSALKFIAAVSNPKRGPIDMSGGTEYDAAGYHVHEFTTSGTLTVVTAGAVEYLVVGGGGSGGKNHEGAADEAGAGGGAGEMQEGISLIVNTTQTITIGAGGIGPGTSTTNGVDGGDSSIGALVVALGGGYGVRGRNGHDPGGDGGCGGGGNSEFSSGVHFGEAIGTGFGFDGSIGNYNDTGGGGGGAGGPAVYLSSTSVGVDGGPARANSITGSSVDYSKGGRGGNKDGTTAGADGATPGSGGDGGYGDSTTKSGDGAAGTVIIRYPL
jgi:hypothetical protein